MGDGGIFAYLGFIGGRLDGLQLVPFLHNGMIDAGVWSADMLPEGLSYFDLRQNAGLGGQNDVAVIGELPAAGTEAVAVEQGADLGAVGEVKTLRVVRH